MTDEVAIQQILNRYTEAASRADWKEVVSTFAPDGIWEIVSLGKKFQGHAALLEAMPSLVKPLEYCVQMNAPGVITIDGDKATARSVIREVGKFADRDEVFETFGFYADKLIRTSEGWRFAHRVFQRHAMHNYKISDVKRGKL